MKKIAVILSGCGFKDGAEINESVLTFLALEKAGVAYEIFAPNMNQSKVINHITDEEMNETRNVLVEASRIARGDIQDIKNARADEFDAVILPGGFGAISNLCDFAQKGGDCHINADVEAFLKQMSSGSKPAGFICIAPAIAAKLYGDQVNVTIGIDEGTANAIESMNAKHQVCTVDHIVVDKAHKVVTTPAYMLGPGVKDVSEGIEKLVNAVVAMA